MPLPDPGDGDGQWIRLVPIGEYPFHHDGSHAIDGDAVEQMVRNFRASSTDVMVDRDHHSLWGDTAALGWIADVEARDDGLYGQYPNWTPEGDQLVRDRAYRYFSPVYYRRTGKDGLDRGWALDSVALTNRPYFDEGEIDRIGNSSPTETPSTPDDDPSDTMDRNEIAKLLGIDADDVTDEMIANSIKELRANQKADDEPDPEALQPEAEESTDSDTSHVARLNARIDALEKSQRDEAAQSAKARAEGLVDAAVNQGKIMPSQREIYLNGATVDFDRTKAALDAIKPNEAMPSKVRTRNAADPPSGPSPAPNRREQMREYVNSFYPG